MKKLFAYIFRTIIDYILVGTFLLVLLSLNGYTQELSYGIGNWKSEELGNHRAVTQVDEPSDAVNIDFLWCRHDAKF